MPELRLTKKTGGESNDSPPVFCILLITAQRAAANVVVFAARGVLLSRAAKLDYQVSFKPTCMARLLPDPMSGLPASKSFVPPE